MEESKDRSQIPWHCRIPDLLQYIEEKERIAREKLGFLFSPVIIQKEDRTVSNKMRRDTVSSWVSRRSKTAWTASFVQWFKRYTRTVF